MKKFAAPRKNRASNRLKAPRKSKLSREYVHSLYGTFRGKQLLKALIAEKEFERQL
jgi:DMSO reductase anchor subunit